MDIWDFKSVFEMLKYFPDEQSCIDYLEDVRWRGEVISPFDEASKVYRCSNGRYRCSNTGKYFNVKTGSMFENTKIPLKKWFYAIYMATAHKKGISSLQLSRDLNITQKTAWFMLQRIRNCFGAECIECLENEVEADETYIGGKNKNRHKNKKVKNSQGRSVKDKTPVFGMVQRSGVLVAKVVADTKASTLMPNVNNWVKKDSFIYTDEWQAYLQLNINYKHEVVHHGEGEYVSNRAHTNTMEGFWGLLKRGIVGVYHNVSRKHLQRYVDEFVFRYNTRKISESKRFALFLQQTGNRLTYQELISNVYA